MLDSPEGVCAGQAGFEYPATSVPFSNSFNGSQRQVQWKIPSHTAHPNTRRLMGSWSW
jgi:hypothetical protein